MKKDYIEPIEQMRAEITWLEDEIKEAFEEYNQQPK